MPSAPAASLHRSTFLAAGIFGLLAVALGAFGAHGLKPLLAERGTLANWETAAHYHLVHAVALLGVGVALLTSAAERSPTLAKHLLWAGRCWAVGITIFSGTLYILATVGPKWLGAITPIGGVALILGWLFVAAAANSRKD